MEGLAPTQELGLLGIRGLKTHPIHGDAGGSDYDG
jgi:hypothetical protein